MPTLTSAKVHKIKGTKRDVEIYSLGGGHSNSDAFVYLPDEKIAFIGDLVFVHTHPSVHQQPIQEWLSILEELDHFDLKTIVPGHGDIGDKTNIKETSTYLSMLWLTAKGTDNLTEYLIPMQYRNWAFPHVYEWNINALKQQLDRLKR